MAVTINMRELLEAGSHYGHQCRRWNAKMRSYIFGERNGIHIIDLQKTVSSLKKACKFAEEIVARKGQVLFVGTKRQARSLIAEEASRCGMFYVNYRWLGGTLTNNQTMKQSIHTLKKLEKMSTDGTYEKLTKKEALNFERLREKLERNLGGIKDMRGLPDAVFVCDAHKEHIAIKEAKKLNIPIIAIADTNADPEGIDYVVPGNDDSLKSLKLFTKTIAEACLSGKNLQNQFQDKDEKKETKEGTIYDQEGHTVKVMKKKKEA
ncbi:MAG: 30S ribosomal protein S2 [Zetaproteobacteria bacterium]|nr:30S ribosomal protein S2 [Pseudobdellovibrionaceae bacterium]